MFNDEDIKIIDEIYNEGYLFAQYGIYLKKKFRQKIFKIPVDIGLSCPNEKNNRCIYCQEMGRSVSVKYCNAKIPLKEQIEKQMENQKKKGFKNSRNQGLYSSGGAPFFRYVWKTSNMYSLV